MTLGSPGRGPTVAPAIEQPDGGVECRRAQVHVTLRDPELAVPRESWIARAGAPRIARCEQNVWRRMWTPSFTFARLAAHFIRAESRAGGEGSESKNACTERPARRKCPQLCPQGFREFDGHGSWLRLPGARAVGRASHTDVMSVAALGAIGVFTPR